ncbi:hypothetical protein XM38_026800 [Halomicronema hongdechloris C2206]|uniref:Uncharacterized protein n=1 Tax=Halomicronema hongdechloris C2206 TaxID=1641165 RepID=A0A1Z3HN84_9CYAN|nr:hypothetical protein [Halomicronema hongdechloris]ASC71726.1 hypothetical protein XM38_026800 [Halomicronema hongdechloris C2206]
MSQPQPPTSSLSFTPLWVGEPEPDVDWALRGTDYLATLRQWAYRSDMIELRGELRQRLQMCEWIGHNIHRVNQHLNQLLADCQACFHPQARPPVHILAAPLAERMSLDGFCNLSSQPITLFIDVGCLIPDDWLGVIAHEYTHAVLRSPGHDQGFGRVLSHLCLGLGLPVPPSDALESGRLAVWPRHHTKADPADFWQGNTMY